MFLEHLDLPVIHQRNALSVKYRAYLFLKKDRLKKMVTHDYTT